MEEKILLAIEGLKQDFNQKMGSLSSKVDTISGEVGSLSGRVNTLSDKVDSLENQVSENTQILKALEHLAQINKAEHDRMTFDLAEISSEVKSIRKDLSTVELVTANNWSDIVKLKSIK